MGKPETLKLVFIGDSTVGKTSLLIKYTTKEFPASFLPTFLDNYAVNFTLPGVEIAQLLKKSATSENDANLLAASAAKMPPDREYIVGLFDSAGGEDYQRLRPLAFSETDIFLIGFDISNEETFKNVRTHYRPEILHHMPKTPWLLVGLKSDLRENEEEDEEENAFEKEGHSRKKKKACVSVERAKTEATELNATKYVECSALQGLGVNEVFSEAIKAAVQTALTKEGFKKCLLL